MASDKPKVDIRDRREANAFRDMRTGKGKPRQVAGYSSRLIERDADDDEDEGRELVGYCVIVYLRDGADPSKDRSNFRHFCRKNGIIATPCDRTFQTPENWEGIPFAKSEEFDVLAYSCVGDVADLDNLADMAFVGNFHLPWNAPHSFNCGGSGTLTPAGEKRLRVAKNQTCERFADVDRGERMATAKANATTFRDAVRGMLPTGTPLSEHLLLTFLCRWYLVSETAPQTPGEMLSTATADELAEFKAELAR